MKQSLFWLLLLLLACGDDGVATDGGTSADGVAGDRGTSDTAPVSDGVALDTTGTDRNVPDVVRDVSIPDAGPPVTTFAELLAETPTLRAEEREDAPTGYQSFDIWLTQPVDHAGGIDATFEQKALLLLKQDAPRDLATVLNISGYALSPIADETIELTAVLDGHQLSLEHRHFGESDPSDPDYTYFSSETEAADIQGFVTVFQRLLVGPWISTGRSRGGAEAISHRSMFPGVIAGTVAFVTVEDGGDPIDRRWEAALNAFGDETCRTDLYALQRAMLSTRRAELVGALERGFRPPPTFARMGGVEAALDAIVADLPLSFWIYYTSTGGCSSLRGLQTAPLTDLANFLLVTGGVDFFSDMGQARFEPAAVARRRDEGIPVVPIDHLDDLFSREYSYFEAAGTIPDGLEVSFDPDFGRRQDTWLAESAERILYIDGELDAWSAVTHQVDAAREITVVTAPGQDHFTAQIQTLAPADRETALRTIRAWAGE